MKIKILLKTVLLGISVVGPVLAHAEILALVNYESKPKETLRREGIAIIDIDPDSENFAKILTDIPLPPDTVAHHIFYNKDMSKAYITALGQGPLRVMDMKRYPYRLKRVAVPDCQVGEDIVFSEDNKTWYLTCMGSSNVIVGDAVNDKPVKTIAANDPDKFIRYPHGIGLQENIDRIIVTSTVRPSDLGDPGDSVSVIEASTGKVLSTHKLAHKADATGVAPVEVVFLPHANPPVAYIDTLFGGILWTATWKAATHDFDFQPAYDFSSIKQGVPLEIYLNQKHDRLYVTTANPGALNIFDLSQAVTKPVLLKSIPTAGGAHHVVFSPDEKYAFVQNSFLNLPDMSDGSISVIDLQKMEKKASIDTFKKQGFNPNCILLLPEWNRDIAH